ncbi:hypothetical protein [Morganella morganii]
MPSTSVENITFFWPLHQARKEALPTSRQSWIAPQHDGDHWCS